MGVLVNVFDTPRFQAQIMLHMNNGRLIVLICLDGNQLKWTSRERNVQSEKKGFD